MRILAVSDVVDTSLYSPSLESRVGGVDVIVSCGDLPFDYLEYLVTFTGKPLFYVRGNHDPPKDTHRFPKECVELDGNVERAGYVSFAGFPGCLWYSGGDNQYTEGQMRLKALSTSIKMRIQGLLGHKKRLVFVSHASPHGVGDREDRCHEGFLSFLNLLKNHSPELWIHGHVHLYRRSRGDTSYDHMIGDTRVVNAYGYRIFDI